MAEHTPDFTGRKALVLGANDANAAAVALALAKAGADVAVTSTTGDAEEAFSLRPLRRAIEAEGRQAIADIADLGNGSSVQIAVRQVAKQLGRIDIVVVASNEAVEKPSERLTDAEWSRIIGYSLGAYFYVARAAVKEFAGNEAVEGVKGRIAALLPALDRSTAPPASLAARGGVEALIEGLAREWADQGVVVRTVPLEAGTGEDGAVEAVFRALSGDE